MGGIISGSAGYGWQVYYQATTTEFKQNMVWSVNWNPSEISVYPYINFSTTDASNPFTYVDIFTIVTLPGQDPIIVPDLWTHGTGPVNIEWHGTVQYLHPKHLTLEVVGGDVADVTVVASPLAIGAQFFVQVTESFSITSNNPNLAIIKVELDGTEKSVSFSEFLDVDDHVLRVTLQPAKYNITGSYTVTKPATPCKYSPYANFGGGPVAVAPRCNILANGGILNNGGTVEVDAGDSVMIGASTNIPNRISSMVVSEYGEAAGPGTNFVNRVVNFTPTGDVTVTVVIEEGNLFCGQIGGPPNSPPQPPIPPPFFPPPGPGPIPPVIEVLPPVPPDPPKYGGCTNPAALNYDPGASYDDGSCVLKPVDPPPLTICLDWNAENFMEEGVCTYKPLIESEPIDFIVVDAGAEIELTKIDGVYQAEFDQLVKFVPVDAFTPFWWSFGDYQMSIEESPEHRYYYNQSYTFYPSLLAANNLDELQYVRKAIHITYSHPFGWRPVNHGTGLTLPTVAGVYQATSGERIRFVPWGLAEGEARTWDFKDLATSTLDEPQHVYVVSTPTVYAVDLELVADGRVVTHSINVVVDSGERIPPNPAWPDADILGQSMGMTLRWRDEQGAWSQERFISLRGRDPHAILNRLGHYRIRQWEIVMTHASPQVVVYMEEEAEVTL